MEKKKKKERLREKQEKKERGKRSSDGKSIGLLSRRSWVQIPSFSVRKKKEEGKLG